MRDGRHDDPIEGSLEQRAIGLDDVSKAHRMRLNAWASIHVFASSHVEIGKKIMLKMDTRITCLIQTKIVLHVSPSRRRQGASMIPTPIAVIPLHSVNGNTHTNRSTFDTIPNTHCELPGKMAHPTLLESIVRSITLQASQFHISLTENPQMHSLFQRKH